MVKTPTQPVTGAVQQIYSEAKANGNGATIKWTRSNGEDGDKNWNGGLANA